MKSGRLGKKSIALLLCMTILLGSIISVNASELENSDANQIVSTESTVTESTEETETTEDKESTESTESTESSENSEKPESTETSEADTENLEDTAIEKEVDEEQTEILEEDVPMASLFSLFDASTYASNSSKCLIGLSGSQNNTNAIVKDSTYVEVISENEPKKNNGSYIYNINNNSNTDKYYLAIVVEYEDNVIAKCPASDNQYLRYDSTNQSFSINTAEGYQVSDVYLNVINRKDQTSVSTFIELNENGKYSCKLNKLNSTNTNKNSYVNELKIVLSKVEEKPVEPSEPTEIGETADFKANLFKYNKDAINEASKAINSSKYLNIGTASDSWNSCHYAGAYQNLAGSSLINGMITFPNYGTSNFFTSPLKEEGRTDFYTVTENEKTSYFNVTFPFEKNGNEYSYDSSKLSATLDTNSGIINLGDANGGFWPFGEKKYYFGMNFATDFYMTSDGKVDGEDIVFEFSGDDDVWVYIDGKLVLDLGGIHGAVAGSINFNTGVVSFSDAGVDSSQKGVIYKDSKADYISDITENDSYITAASYNFYEYSENGLTKENLLDGDVHELQVYYMERGAGSSNCKIKFNLPQTPQQNVLKITNTVQNTVNGESVEDNTTFSYIVKKDETVLANTAFTHKTSDGTTTAMTTDANGKLTLKDGESAVFTSPEEGIYIITEVLETGYETSYEAKKNDVQTSSDGPIQKSSEITTLEATHTIVTEMNKKGDLYQVDFLNTKTAIDYTFDSNKTATLVNWDDRTYDITLSASSTTQYTTGGDTTVTVVKPAVDVVLLLDVSGSMEGDSISNLKTAAKNFVQGVYENADSKSQIAIVTFNTSAITIQELTNLTENNVSTIKGKIDGISANDGTNQAEALKRAQEILANSTNANKYVILFTDGKPDTNGQDYTDDETPIANEAYDYATTIKNYATLYTVRLGDVSGGSVSYLITGSHIEKYWFFGWHEYEVIDYKYNNRTYVEWLTDLATDANHALSISNSSQLNSIFEQIKNEVTTPTETVSVALNGVTIVDTIDARFELTVGEKERLESDGATVVINTDGTTTITWTEQTLNAATETDGVVTPGWSKDIHVKAKNEYVGGNAVATNVKEKSYILLKDKVEEFEQPTVNVKVNLEVGNHLEEIFLGETVPTDTEILKNLFDAEDGFELTWYTDKALTSEISVPDMAKETPGIDGAEYYLKVTYNAGEPTEDSNNNTMVDGQSKYNGTLENGYKVEATNKDNADLNYGIYTIKAIDGQITITKQIKASDYKKSEGDPIFTFKITGYETGAVYYKTLRFSDITGSGDVIRETTITGLCKDNYTIEELTTLGYQLKSVSTEGSKCIATVANNRVTFEIGTKYPENDTKIYGREGKALFVNEKSRNSGKLTDTDVVKNSFVLGEEANESKTTHDADNMTIWNAYTTITTKKEEEE